MMKDTAPVGRDIEGTIDMIETEIEKGVDTIGGGIARRQGGEAARRRADGHITTIQVMDIHRKGDFISSKWKLENFLLNCATELGGFK
jgi:hypothetical protein